MHVANAITVQTKATALLSGAEEASLCRGSRVWEEGNKKARRAKQSKMSSALSTFRLLLFLLGYPAGAWAKEREATVLGNAKHYVIRFATVPLVMEGDS